MINYSPTLVVLKANQHDIKLKVTSDSKALEFSLIAYSKAAGELKQFTCKTLSVVVNANSEYTLDQQHLIESIKQCKTQYKSFAIGISPKVLNSTKLSSIEQVLLPIVNETSLSLLQKERTATVLGELSKTYQVEPLSCEPSFTWFPTDLTCSTTVTNTSDTAVLLTFVTSFREKSIKSTTVYEKIERSSTLLLPETPYAITFIIPKEKYAQGNYAISSKVGITMVGSIAQSFTVIKESNFTYLSSYFIAMAAFLLIVISGILIKNLHKLTIKKAHGASPKTT